MSFSFARLFLMAVLSCCLLATPAVSIAARTQEMINHSGTSKLDKDFAREVARGLQRDIALAVLAERRAGTTDVKVFARKVRDRRQQALDNLRQLMKQTRLVPPNGLDDYQRREIRTLRGLIGPNFDKKFLSYISHPNYIRFFDFELHSGALRTYQPVQGFVAQQLPILHRDIARAKELLSSYP